MARSKINPSTSVTFRMPDSILKEVDRLALQNYHDRTAEINGACRHWIEIGGTSGVTSSSLEEITKLSEQLQNLEEQIVSMMQQMKQERSLLLKIIENHEHTIKCLLATLPQQDPATEKIPDKK